MSMLMVVNVLAVATIAPMSPCILRTPPIGWHRHCAMRADQSFDAAAFEADRLEKDAAAMDAMRSSRSCELHGSGWHASPRGVRAIGLWRRLRWRMRRPPPPQAVTVCRAFGSSCRVRKRSRLEKQGFCMGHFMSYLDLPLSTCLYII